MKKVSTFAFLLLFNFLFCQFPNKISYQANLRDLNNLILSNKNISIKISLFSDSQLTKKIYSEFHFTKTNTNGLISIIIGDGENIQGDLEYLKWSEGSIYIQSELDPTGGTNFVIKDAKKLLSVPFAFHSKTAESLTNSAGIFKHYIGEYFEGGIIFHLYFDSQKNERGLIVSLNNLNELYEFSNVDSALIGETSNWDGETNSMNIVNQSGHTRSAAMACLDLEANGFNDWYLPSIGELELLYARKVDVNRALKSIVNSDEVFKLSDICWSSTEVVLISALRLDPNRGSIISWQKKNKLRVRPIRKF
jgi:hypothetical protein